MPTFATAYYICIRVYKTQHIENKAKGVGFQHVILQYREGTSPSAKRGFLNDGKSCFFCAENNYFILFQELRQPSLSSGHCPPDADGEYV